jgi:glycosyltransferase involved in cell wall biosynthesis
MRIALIGDFNAKTDEGMRRLCTDIRHGMETRHEVLALNSEELRHGSSFGRLRKFQPELLHYLTGPTFFSLISLKAHQLALGGRIPTIATGLKPFLDPTGRRFLPLVRPTVFLGQSRRWVDLFAKAGSRVIDFPNWTRLERFQKPNPFSKQELRQKYGLPAEGNLIFHVGHIKPNRNLECLIPAQQSGRYKAVVLGSETLSEKGACRDHLEKSGVLIKTMFAPEIQEFYKACDFYVFTAKAMPANQFPETRHSIGVIDFPLSILEALASGLPVASTRHDAVEHFLGKRKSLRFFNGSGEGCLATLDELANQPLEQETNLEQFSLENRLNHLDSIYKELTSVKKK